MGHQHPRPSQARLFAARVLTLSCESFYFHSLFPWPLPRACSASHLLLPSNRLCNGCDFALLKSLILAMLVAGGS